MEARERGLPLVGALGALLLVDVVGCGPELGAVEVVGEVFALGVGPVGGAGLWARLLVLCCCFFWGGGGCFCGRGTGRRGRSGLGGKTGVDWNRGSEGGVEGE